MTALITGSVAFAVLPVTPDGISCGTVANPDFTHDRADPCQDALAARRAASAENITVSQRGHCQWGCVTAAISDRRGLDLLGAREV
jgi:hypothetical protein